MEIHPAALKHGPTETSIRHAVEHSLVEADDETEAGTRRLIIGPDPAGNLLELLAIETDTGDLLVFHAMTMRPKYRDLLQGMED